MKITFLKREIELHDFFHAGRPAFLFFLLAVLAGVPSLFAWVREPFVITLHEFDFSLGLLAEAGGLTPLSGIFWGYLAHYVLLLGMGLCFYRIVLAEAQSGASLAGRDLLFGSLLVVPFVWYLPWLSPDVFCYLGLGWIQSAHGMSPYLQTIAQAPDFPEHPIYRNILPPWNHVVTPYGPLFLRFMDGLTSWGKGDERTCLLLLKVTYLLLHYVNAWLAGQAGKCLGMRERAVFLFFLLNPVLLFCYIGRLHNDILMISCLLAGMLFLLKRRDWMAMFFLAAGVGFKYVPVLMLPLVLIYTMRGDRSRAGLVRVGSLGLYFLILCFLSHVLVDGGVTGFWQILQGKERLLGNMIHLSVASWTANLGLLSTEAFGTVTRGLFYLIYGVLGIKLLMLGKTIRVQDLFVTLVLMFFWYFLLMGVAFHEWYVGWFLVCLFGINRLDYFRAGLVLTVAIPSLVILTGLRFYPAYVAGWLFVYAVLAACLAYLCRPGAGTDPGSSPLFGTGREQKADIIA